ncbi:DUF1804 family protein [Limnobaculum zhutongyuii]|uniref:DUF1804 family protein n=1 Tax=Limnobaculum zhutongyuii TaxID=2498113 RepID=A0A411WIH3_9GAMM|nr:DUF1804 family protein [Limnobaculum zhutongyuii]QBH95982.1 DUF1804 family protein [Limnobaculum zhutongyuii]TQS89307.1 DUF1804 family protein [Limnobaculum zhutongyuii]
MAWPQEIRESVRHKYIFNQLTLEQVSADCGVPFDTVRRWKAQALAKGDDWEKLRTAHTIAGGTLEDITRTVLTSLVIKFQSVIERINSNPDLPPEQSVELLTSIADAFSKATAASRRVLPETDRLATALEVVQLLGTFISENYPQHLSAFAEVLEPFGEKIGKSFG